MTKAAQVFEKISKKNKSNDFSFKRLAYGVMGGTTGALLTAPASTISTLAKGEGGPTIPQAIKTINREARAMKASSKAGKIFNYIKRYYRGTIPKILAIGPATGVAWAVANALEKKYGE